MNIETLKWDPYLCKVFDIPMHILPEIKSSSEIYGYITDVTLLTGIPISGVIYQFVMEKILKENLCRY